MSNKVTIDINTCKGCKICVEFCPKKVLEMNKDKLNDKGYNPAFVANIEKCIACGICGMMCPDSAIKVEKEV